jgi:hypothetical protein
MVVVALVASSTMPVASRPRTVSKYKVTKVGSDLVVGWITGNNLGEALGLARVRP